MNKRDKEIAVQSELMRKYNYAYSKELQAFADLIRADEREECAKVCEEDGLLWGQRYAAAIRARGAT
jgi:hypothetical protein